MKKNPATMRFVRPIPDAATRAKDMLRGRGKGRRLRFWLRLLLVRRSTMNSSSIKQVTRYI